MLSEAFTFVSAGSSILPLSLPLLFDLLMAEVEEKGILHGGREVLYLGLSAALLDGGLKDSQAQIH